MERFPDLTQACLVGQGFGKFTGVAPAQLSKAIQLLSTAQSQSVRPGFFEHNCVSSKHHSHGLTNARGQQRYSHNAEAVGQMWARADPGQPA